MESKAVTLAIVGKSREVPPAELQRYDEVWTVGTNYIEADRYFCFHGEGSVHPERDSTWHECIHLPVMYTLPMANSVCIMLASVAADIEVEHKQYASVHILASPLLTKKEMERERMAVAGWCGYLMGLGVSVYWEGGWNRTFPYMLNEYYDRKGDVK